MAISTGFTGYWEDQQRRMQEHYVRMLQGQYPSQYQHMPGTSLQGDVVENKDNLVLLLED